MDAFTLHQAISEVCPVVGTNVVDGNNRQTWSFEPDGSATQPEIDAGNNVIATIPMTPAPTLTPPQFILRFTDEEYLALYGEFNNTFAANDIKLRKVWDMLIGSPSLDLNSSEAQTLKTGLVSGGVLTQARADEIFGAPLAPLTLRSRMRKKG